MNRFCAVFAAASLGVVASSCALSFDSSHLGVPVTMASAARTPVTGTAFRVTRHPVYVAWGAFTAGTPRLEDVLAGQVGTGTGISDLRIRVRARWSDLLLTAMTLGFLSPRTVTFEGTVQGQQPPAQP